MIPQNFIRHKVRPDDTLTSLAQRINISENDLREFHNQNCGKMNKLWVTNLKGIEFVMIPTHFITEEEQENQNRKMLPSENYFQNFHANRYSVEENFEHPGKQESKFNYIVNLNIQQKQRNFVADVELKNYTKNGSVPDDKISSLSLECMKSIYPISFELSENGTIHSCFAHQKIIEKFKSKKNDIEDFHIGEISKNYLETFEQNISDESYFLRQTQSNILYQILFPNLNWLHKKTVWKDKFTVYPNSFPLEFECKTEHEFKDEKYIQTTISGNLSENCSLRELLKGMRIEDESTEYNVQVEIEINYSSDKISKQLLKVKSSVKIWFQDELFQEHHLQLTQN